MATTNFQIFNPSESNQMNDATYTSNTLRSGGITVDALLPSPLLNKAYYQWSTFVAAFCQMLVNKGVSTADSNRAAIPAITPPVPIPNSGNKRRPT